MTINVGNIREWRGQDVVDPGGKKIGTLESIYFDTANDQPLFAAITTGLINRKLIFAPLEDAEVGPTYLKVTVSEEKASGSPSIGTDGELTVDEEVDVLRHYGLPAGQDGRRRMGRR